MLTRPTLPKTSLLLIHSLAILLGSTACQNKPGSTTQTETSEATHKPNIVLFYIDNLGDVGYIVANPAFTELYETVSGKELNGKLIRSKYDLLSVLAASVAMTMMEDKAEVQIPIQVQ